MEWPRPNDKLVRSDVDWEYNACIDVSTPTLGSYAGKFKEAADILVKEAAAGDTMLDVVVIPIMFLYRHYLELTLKEIIVFGREVVGSEPVNNLSREHSLENLWQEASVLLTAHYGADVPPETNAVSLCIDDLHQYDPNSFAWRYPTDRDGKPYLHGLRHINIRNLYETMSRLASFLDCIGIDLGTAFANHKNG